MASRRDFLMGTAGLATLAGCSCAPPEAVQPTVLEVAGLALAVAELGDAETLALAVAHLADIAHAVIGEPLGVLQVRPRGPRGDNACLARHRTRGPSGFVGALQHGAGRQHGARGLIDQGLLGRIGRGRRCRSRGRCGCGCGCGCRCGCRCGCGRRWRNRLWCRRRRRRCDRLLYARSAGDRGLKLWLETPRRSGADNDDQKNGDPERDA